MDKDKKKNNRCMCGKFKKDKRKKLCSTCEELERLRRENGYLKERDEQQNKMLSQCRIEKDSLIKKVKTMEEKKRYPCWFEVQNTKFSCTKEYLKNILERVAPVSDAVHIEYGRNPE